MIAAIPSTAYGWLMLAGIFASIFLWSRLARLVQPRQGRHLCRNAWQRFKAPSGATYSPGILFSKHTAHWFRNMSPRWGLDSISFDFYKDIAPDGAFIQ
jgi:hypothetical protein